MKTIKKLSLGLLAGTLLCTYVTPIYAETVPSNKEEVIYINLNTDGSVEEVYAVNIFDSGKVTDYGTYESVKMLNTDDTIKQNGDEITFNASADRTYYQGTMSSSTEIPWIIAITYTLDGKTYSADEIAGKSGHLQMHFTVTKNEDYNGTFYEDYALQASFTLDTNTCTNIIAEDATIANVGSDKQLSYTMLPSKGIDTVIAADVTDFEMDAVSINGVPLSLNVDIDDEDLLSQVNDLIDAIGQLDDGATELNDGASDLKDGGSEVNDGSSSLKQGTADLYTGVQSLTSGIALAQNGLDTLNAQSDALTSGSAEVKATLLLIQQKLSGVTADTDKITALVNGSAEMKTKIDELSAAVTEIQNGISYDAYKQAMSDAGGDIDTLQTNNTNMINTLTEQIAQLEGAGQDATEYKNILALLQANTGAITGMENYLNGANSTITSLSDNVTLLKSSYAELDAGINELTNTMSTTLTSISELKAAIDELVKKYEELDTGIYNYTGGVAEIIAGYSQVVDGSVQVLSGSKNVKDGTSTLSDGTDSLLNGINDLYDGTSELKEGTSELKDETDGMDAEISDKIDDMLESITGDNTVIHSFVSDKNTNVEAVQFVIQTKAITIDETVTTENSTEETLTFWQKLLKLFGID